MPTYQYKCADCGELLEAVQRFHDAPLTECPNCGGRLRKQFSPVGVVFKGSGFYKTDSRSASRGTGSGSGAAGKAKTTDGASSDSSAGSSGSGTSSEVKKPATTSSDSAA